VLDTDDLSQRAQTGRGRIYLVKLVNEIKHMRSPLVRALCERSFGALCFLTAL
jgi:hypothetical protein